MIALVEGADRQKTPNEIALNILLAGLTIIFLIALVTLQPFAIYSGAEQTIVVLVALLVCLIPTTIGALLSAIGIAGMDRLVQRNVLAMSGPRCRGGGRRLHVAARQDRHDHLRQPAGGGVPSRWPGSRRATWPRPRCCRAWPTRRRRAARSSMLARRVRARAARARATLELVPFTAQTRMSGVDFADRSIRKGAADSVKRCVVDEGRRGARRRSTRSSSGIARGGRHAARRRRAATARSSV